MAVAECGLVDRLKGQRTVWIDSDGNIDQREAFVEHFGCVDVVFKTPTGFAEASCFDNAALLMKSIESGGCVALHLEYEGGTLLNTTMIGNGVKQYPSELRAGASDGGVAVIGPSGQKIVFAVNQSSQLIVVTLGSKNEDAAIELKSALEDSQFVAKSCYLNAGFDTYPIVQDVMFRVVDLGGGDFGFIDMNGHWICHCSKEGLTLDDVCDGKCCFVEVQGRYSRFSESSGLEGAPALYPPLGEWAREAQPQHVRALLVPGDDCMLRAQEIRGCNRWSLRFGMRRKSKKFFFEHYPVRQQYGP